MAEKRRLQAHSGYATHIRTQFQIDFNIGNISMLQNERSAVFSLSLIMAFRMLGLFMILPVFSVYANQLAGSTSFLIGVALGIYGLTQACLQLPFGMWSDKIGRKPVICIGLILFAMGSILAALSHSIEGIILGRALQGAGAIGSTCIALVADLTCDENRSKAMALIGMSIGLAFMIALILGPILNTWFHLKGIFWATTLFAGIGLLLLFTCIPTPPKLIIHEESEAIPARLKRILCHKELLRLDIGVACSHAILMATFVAIPILLTHTLQLNESHQTSLYVCILCLSFFAMTPFIIIAEKKRHMKSIFCSAIFIMGLTQCLLFFLHNTLIEVAFILFLFFTAFTLLEASLPSLVSKIAPIRLKGTATGIYSSSQFLGIFIGGSVGGWLYGHFHLTGVFLFNSVLATIWLALASTMKQPPYLSTFIFKWPHNTSSTDSHHFNLLSINGIYEVALMPKDNLIYIKADKQIIDENELRNLIQQGTLRRSSV